MPDSSRPKVDLPGPLGPTLARGQLQRDPVQHLLALPVGEPQIASSQLSPGRLLVTGNPVLRHLSDAEQPGRRGHPDLQSVQVADQSIQRLDQRLQIQRGGGDLPQGQAVIGVTDPADHHHHHQRRVVGQPDEREQDVAQRHGVALGLRRHRDVLVTDRDPLPLQPEGLDGPRSLDRLGQGGVDRGIGRALGDVALRRTGQITPDADHQQRRDDQQRQGQDHRVEQHRHQRQRSGHRRDDCLRQPIPNALAHGRDIPGDPSDQVTRARALHLAQRQPQHRTNDPFPGARKHVLTEHRRGQQCAEREQGLQHHDRTDSQTEVGQL